MSLVETAVPGTTATVRVPGDWRVTAAATAWRELGRLFAVTLEDRPSS